MDPTEYDVWQAGIATFRARGHALPEAIDFANVLVAAYRRRRSEGAEGPGGGSGSGAPSDRGESGPSP